MTEDTGWAVPGVTPAPEPPAEPDPEQETPAAPEPVEEHPALYVPDGQPQWLRDLVAAVDERLRALGG